MTATKPATASRWRLASIRAIDEALSALAPDADYADCCAAIRDAYPFGERDCYPYTVYLSERRRALETRFPHLRATDGRTGTVRRKRRGDSRAARHDGVTASPPRPWDSPSAPTPEQFCLFGEEATP